MVTPLISLLTLWSSNTHLAVFAVLDVLLPVQEPVWDFVLARILHDGHHPLHLSNKQLVSDKVDPD